jgi:hypothetical protein
MRSRRQYHANTAFLDLLFNTLLAFVGLFAMALAMMNVTKQTKTTESNAEFMIYVTWDKDLDVDVDTYVENPDGALIMYRRLTEGLMHLERDDTGTQSDTIQTQFGPISFDDNREVVSIRSSMQGEYTVNVHAFSFHRRKNNDPVEVTVRLDKINPYSTAMIKKVKLNNSGDEETAFRFTVNKKGEIVSFSTLPKKFTGGASGDPGGYNDEYNYNSPEGSEYPGPADPIEEDE